MECDVVEWPCLFFCGSTPGVSSLSGVELKAVSTLIQQTTLRHRKRSNGG